MRRMMCKLRGTKLRQFSARFQYLNNVLLKFTGSDKSKKIPQEDLNNILALPHGQVKQKIYSDSIWEQSIPWCARISWAHGGVRIDIWRCYVTFIYHDREQYTKISKGLLKCFFPSNAITRHKRKMRRMMCKLRGTKLRQFSARFQYLNNVLLKFTGSDKSKKIPQEDLNNILALPHGQVKQKIYSDSIWEQSIPWCARISLSSWRCKNWYMKVT